MKITIRHKETSVTIDDESDATRVKYETENAQIIRLIKSTIDEVIRLVGTDKN